MSRQGLSRPLAEAPREADYYERTGVLCATACCTLASRKNRPVVAACLLGFAFGVFSVFGYAIVRERTAFA